MKEKLKNLINPLIAAGVLASPSFADEPLFKWELSNPVLSNYVFWGMEFGEDPVWQPTLKIEKNGFTGTTFTNLDLAENDLNEVDVFGDYYFPLGESTYVLVGGGLYNFKLGDEWDKDQEIYAGVGILNPVESNLFYHHLFGLGDGYYVEGNSAKEFGERLSFRPSLGLGYHNNEYTEAEGLTHLEIGADANYQITPRINLGASSSYVRSLDDKLENSFSVGLSATLSN
jgi:hypothetical protein